MFNFKIFSNKFKQSFIYLKASGIQVDQNCVDEFNSFKLGKKYSYLLFGFSEDATKITVKHAEPKNYADSDSLKVKSIF